MAVAYQSSEVSTLIGRGNGEYVTVTKPTGTTDGDLLVLHVTLCDPSGGETTTVDLQDSGGTSDPDWSVIGSSIKSDGASTLAMRVYAKVASSEGASFRVANASGSGLLVGAAMYRIDGQGDITHIQASFDIDAASDATPTFTNTVTPTFANSLLLFLASAGGNQSSSTTSSYAITTSNPSWTERYDVYGEGDSYFGSGDGDGAFAGATASRPETTATGDSTLTWSVAWEISIGCIVVIPPTVSPTATPDVITSTISVQAPTVSGGAIVSPTVVTSTLSVQAPTVTLSASEITNTDKNSSSWVNQVKS